MQSITLKLTNTCNQIIPLHIKEYYGSNAHTKENTLYTVHSIENKLHW